MQQIFADDPETDGRFLSFAASQALAKQIFEMATGGGTTRVVLSSQWIGNLRWARNDVATGGDTQESRVYIDRIIRDAGGGAETNALTEAALRRCVAHAEALGRMRNQSPEDYPDLPPVVFPHATPQLWFERTIQVRDAAMTASADRAIGPAESASLMSAGYIQCAASAFSVFHNNGLVRYYPYTTVQCSITVRDPSGAGSGWAGVDWNDWGRVDVEHLAQTALDKCLRSRHPVVLEPGRYTAILEPQAVCDLVSPLIEMLDREAAEDGRGPFADPRRPGFSRIGQHVIDPRLTLGADPMDPDCGFLPFESGGEPYQAVRWIDGGVLKELSYNRSYAVRALGKNVALPNPRAYRLSGGSATVETMIANTIRGLLVTRFNNVSVLDLPSMLSTGTTRDGLWLIQNGRITKPVHNFRFTESPLFVLNNVEQLGVPQRAFRPDAPAVVPPMMVRDFSFTGLIDAI